MPKFALTAPCWGRVLAACWSGRLSRRIAERPSQAPTVVPTVAAGRTDGGPSGRLRGVGSRGQAVTPSELSTVRVIVSRNDTLDHIFRRLA